MRRLDLVHVAAFCGLIAGITIGLFVPNPLRIARDEGTLQEEVSAVNVIYARKLSADLDKDPSSEAGRAAYAAYKGERINALREVYIRRGKMPPPELRKE